MQRSGRVSRIEMRQTFQEGSSRAQSAYRTEKKVSKEEALQALRDHLAPEDYDRLRAVSDQTGESHSSDSL